MRTSPGLAAYLAVSATAGAMARQILRRRLKMGKEDRQRCQERLGVPGLERPEGTLVWFHSASVGEAMSILELVDILGKRRDDIGFLLTTGTVTSATMLKDRMPARSVHQFVPYDVRSAINSFLDHWRPSVGIWTESELWPALIYESHRRTIPLLCLNARMSSTSFRRWRWAPGMSSALLQRFERVLVQNRDTATYLERLGLPAQRMEVTGSLKQGAAKLPVNEQDLNEVSAAIAGRPVWLAASTHDPEEEIASEAHRVASNRNPGLLLIVAPRHPERGQEIQKRLTERGFRVQRRSAGQLPSPADDIYIADTLGELGIWYRISPVCFLGGSLAECGGHNPFEPAALNCAMMHGPNTWNFKETFAELESEGGSRTVQSSEQVAAAVNEALEPECTERMAAVAADVCLRGTDVIGRASDLIMSYIPKQAAV